MRIVVVLAILSVGLASDSRFLFKSGAKEDNKPLFKAPNSAESYLQQTQPSTFAWWTGFVDNDPDLDNNAEGVWWEEKYVQTDYHGCGFKILYDTITVSGFDNTGIKEIYLIACNPNASNSPKRLYYLLTTVEFMEIKSSWYEQTEDLICDEDSALQEFNIRYRWFDDGIDNLGMTGLSFGCTNGSTKTHNFRPDDDKWGKWMPESRSWAGSSYFVCGGKVKYYPPGWANPLDQSRVSLLDLAICEW